MLMEKGGDRGCGDELMVDFVTKSSPSPFLLKTYMLVDDPDTDHVVSWNADGTGFVVWQSAEFARDLLPTLFKHSNFSSFVRQLNTYGFRKVATSRWEFCNERFRKGRKDLLCQIRRRKSWANKPQMTQTLRESDEDQRSSSTNSLSSGYNILVDENQKLKKENKVLFSELSSMKSKCKELIDLVCMYTSSPKKEEEEDKRPKLFGVRLEVQGDKERKRKRIEEVSESARRILLSVNANE
ncbi:heat shock transcription factor B3 [Artemisia annua]|uniref:Heat shock transcription factor B3 n=1 Tax=Artemisia annua TaxID=35608 RepID=A0A2U1LCQ3_ARTAN|nr:heat shock transcription factor B3 [Artemisia annua]